MPAPSGPLLFATEPLQPLLFKCRQSFLEFSDSAGHIDFHNATSQAVNRATTLAITQPSVAIPSSC